MFLTMYSGPSPLAKTVWRDVVNCSLSQIEPAKKHESLFAQKKLNEDCFNKCRKDSNQISLRIIFQKGPLVVELKLEKSERLRVHVRLDTEPENTTKTWIDPQKLVMGHGSGEHCFYLTVAGITWHWTSIGFWIAGLREQDL